MIDLNTDCVDKSGTVICSDFVGVGASEYIWTRNVASLGRIYEVKLSSDRIGGAITANPGGYGAKYALCK